MIKKKTESNTAEQDKSERKDFIAQADKTKEEIDKKSPTAKRNGFGISMRFNDFELEQLERLRAKFGLTRLGIIRLAIAKLIEQELK